MQWRRMLGRWMCILGVTVMLVGCIDFSSFAPRDPVTIRTVYLGDRAYFELLAEEFHKEHKYITLEFDEGRFYGPERLFDYDVLFVNNAMMPFLREIEYPISLNEFMVADTSFSIDDFYPTARDALSEEGQRWALPYVADVVVMYYNKDLFDRHNVPYPQAGWTWSEFVERAAALSHPDQGEFGYAYHQVGDMATLEPLIWIYQHGGHVFDDLSNPTMMTLNDPLTIEAMQWYADLIHTHRAAPGPRRGERPVPFPLSGIEGGKYAMWMGWSSEIGQWEDINLGVAPLPQDANAMTMGTVMGFVISSRATDPDACWRWITYVSQHMPPFLMPVRRSLVESDTLSVPDSTEAIAAAQASLPHMMTLNIGQQGDMSASWGRAMQALESAVTKIQNGEPVAATLDEAQAQSGF